MCASCSLDIRHGSPGCRMNATQQTFLSAGLPAAFSATLLTQMLPPLAGQRSQMVGTFWA
eukprot:2242349-Pyramimonas_sp.AAC.1